MTVEKQNRRGQKYFWKMNFLKHLFTRKPFRSAQESEREGAGERHTQIVKVRGSKRKTKERERGEREKHTDSRRERKRERHSHR